MNENVLIYASQNNGSEGCRSAQSVGTLGQIQRRPQRQTQRNGAAADRFRVYTVVDRPETIAYSGVSKTFSLLDPLEIIKMITDP